MPLVNGSPPQSHRADAANRFPHLSEKGAADLDEADPLRTFRSQFHIPYPVYLCGNSLGLMPVRTQAAVDSHLKKWSSHAVEAHFKHPQPWASIEERVAKLSVPIVGARYPHEVAVMNSLTVNIHLLLVAFYQPHKRRTKILIEEHAFPSDEYALQSHIRSRGLDPEKEIVRLAPRDGETLLRDTDILAAIDRHGEQLAVILLPGVQYYTGQVFPMREITHTAHNYNIHVGFDLAHAVGNIPLSLHEWEVDFAVWCNYKYLNSGPGAVAGAFLHDRHSEADLPRFAGWWGHDRDSRFRMPREFVAQRGAWGFQISNPPVFSLVPVTESLQVIAEAGGVEALRRKSILLTAFLEQCIGVVSDSVQVISPREETRRGCQLSLRLKVGEDVSIKDVNGRLGQAGVVCDVREPDVLRVAPAPLYNSFADVWSFVTCLRTVMGALGIGRDTG